MWILEFGRYEYKKYIFHRDFKITVKRKNQVCKSILIIVVIQPDSIVIVISKFKLTKKTVWTLQLFTKSTST